MHCPRPYNDCLGQRERNSTIGSMALHARKEWTVSENVEFPMTRRDLLKASGQVAAVAALGTMTLPRAYAADDSTVQLALVGCGGRGSGAAVNAMGVVADGPVKLVAMADVFKDRLASSHKALSERFSEEVNVPEERQFIGFDAYKMAMDVLRPGDVVILTTPPAFRWVHFTYAIEKGLNVFMEKPICVDAASGRRMLELGEKAKEKNLKVGVGLMCRHCNARGELFNRIQDGEIGDIQLLRAYRVTGPTGSAFSPRKPAGTDELEYQIRRFHSFLWASGGGFSDFLWHKIYVCVCMQDAWLVEAKWFSGRHYRGDDVDQNFDSYTVEYTFADGTKLMLEGRGMPGCHQALASYAHGTKGSAIISSRSHAPSRARTFKGQNHDKDQLIWAAAQPEPSPYDLEWEHLINAIRKDLPYNEVERGAKASLVTAMGRMACHTGQVITYDRYLSTEEGVAVEEFAPDVDKLVLGGPAPLQPFEDGSYPLPMPGIVVDREYLVS